MRCLALGPTLMMPGLTEQGSTTLIERWSVSCERRAIRKPSPVDVAVVYKRLILLLRSLFSMLRILPAFALYQKAESARQGNTPSQFILSYSLSSEPKAVFSSPPSNFVFAPVDATSGRLHLSVFYRENCNFAFATPSPHMNSLIIHDYVGSPSDA
jgi:autophagy-related protein 13